MSAPAGLAPEPRLVDAHRTERLGPYLSEVWERRGYIVYVAASELRSRQAHTVLGNLWLILNPVLTVAIYYLIFGLLLDVTRGVDNLILFLTVGVFLFRITQQSTTLGANSIVKNTGLIRSIRFPRAILPLTSVAIVTLSSISTLGVMYAVALLTGEPVRPQWVLLPAVVAMLTLFNCGAAMVAARVTTHFRDTTQILPFVFRLLFYGSGVIFNVSAYAAGDDWITILFTLNPMYGFIEMGRWTMMGGDTVTVGMILSVAAWTVALAVGGFLWFRAGEQGYARD